LNPILKVIRKVFRRKQEVAANLIIIPIPPIMPYAPYVEYGNNMVSTDTGFGFGERLMKVHDHTISRNSPSPRSPLGILPEVRIFRVKDCPEGMMCAADGCNHIFLDGEPYVARPIERDVYGNITYLDVCTRCHYRSIDGLYGQ
jgi:hypothetical protein